MKCGDLLSKKGWTDNADMSTNEAQRPAAPAAGKVEFFLEVEFVDKSLDVKTPLLLLL